MVLKANELLKAVLSISPWVDCNNTVDKIIDGNPDKVLGKVLVVWRCSVETLNIAIREGYDGIIVHEPTYYFHENEAEELAALPDDSPKKETALLKQRMIRENDLVIIRIHDTWDAREEVGIAATWAKSLGLANCVFRAEPMDCERRYDINPTTAGALLETVKKAVSAYQLPLPVLYGDANQAVSRVGIGAGCIADIETYIKMGCDVGICCDDGTSYWQDISFAIDRKFPVIRVSHAAAEEAGIRIMANWIQDRFGIEAVYMQEV